MISRCSRSPRLWRRPLIAVWVLCTGLTGASADEPVAAQLVSRTVPSVNQAQWSKLLEASPASTDQLTRARSELTRAVEALDAFLSSASEQREQGWRDFLAWNAMENQLSRPQPSYRAMELILQRYDRGYLGRSANFSRFRKVQESLRRYLTRLEMVLGDDALNDANLAKIRTGIETCAAALQAADGGEAGAKATELRKQLRWDDLAKLTDPEALANARYAALRGFGGALSTVDTSPLDESPFRELGEGLLERAEFLYITRDGSVRDAYRARIARIEQQLAQLPSQTDDAAIAELLEELAWLEDLGVTRNVPQRARARFRQHNLLVDISDHVVQTALTDESTDSSFNDLCFHRAYVRGIAHSCVRTTPVLVPCTTGAAIELRMQGRSTSNTVGTKRKVDVCNYVVTDLYGCKRLCLTDTGLSAGPTHADAPSKQYIQGVRVNRRCGRRLISRLAVRQTKRLQAEAECVARCIARNKFIRRVDQELATRLADANRQLDEQEARLRDEGLYPQSLNLSSTSHRIYLSALQAAAGRFGAWNPPPAQPGSSEINVRVHQSVMGNVLAQRFGGQRFDQDSIVELIKEAGLEVPPELASGNDGEEPEAWSITLDKQMPISVAFADGMVTVAIRGTRFVQGPENTKEAVVVEDAMEIVAQYQPELVNGKVQAKLVGRVEAEYLDLERQGIGQIGVKTFMRRKVGSLFQEEFTEDNLPTSDLDEMLDGTTLDYLEIRDNWLLAGVDLDDDALRKAVKEAQQEETVPQEGFAYQVH